jgi:general secretion pathway protein K
VKDRGQKTKDRSQRGSALIITVLIVTILVALVVEFAYEVYIDTSSLSNWTNAQKASLIAKSGQTLSTKYLTEINKIYNTQSEVEFRVERDLGLNTQLIIKIEDENARFNINSIIYEKGTSNDEALLSLKNLFEYLNINTQLALVIADWIDPDSEPREGLSDSEENAKNTYLSTVDELKLIKGVNKEVFDTIIPYMTVHENRKRLNRFDTLININTATLPVLVSLPKMNVTLAQRIINYRESTPFEKPSDIVLAGIDYTIVNNLSTKVIFKSSDFRITTRATVNEITRIIESVVDKSTRVQFWREE